MWATFERKNNIIPNSSGDSHLPVHAVAPDCVACSRTPCERHLRFEYVPLPTQIHLLVRAGKKTYRPCPALHPFALFALLRCLRCLRRWRHILSATCKRFYQSFCPRGIRHTVQMIPVGKQRSNSYPCGAARHGAEGAKRWLEVVACAFCTPFGPDYDELVCRSSAGS